MSQKDDINRLESEPIGKLLLRFSLPAVVTMTIFSLYNIISGVFIGQAEGPLAITGLTVTFPFMNLVLAGSMMVAVGGSTVCSIALGAKDQDRATKVLGHDVVLSVISAVIFSAICLLFLDPLLRLFGASDATLSYARDYMEVILWTSPIGNMMIALNHLTRASGYPGRSMIISLASVLVNLALTPVFIFSLGWGMRGAAVSTVLSQIVGLVGLLVHFTVKSNSVHFRPGIFRLEKALAKSMLSVGLSPFFMNACACLVIVVINLSLRHYGGDLSIGAYGIANRLTLLFAMVIIGLTTGMQPIIGYNFGARRMDRVRQTLRYGVIIATGVTAVGFLAFQIFPEPLARMFTRHEELVAMSVNGMRLCTLVFFLVGSQLVMAAYFQSMGKAFISAFLALSRQLFFLLPGLIFLPRLFGLDGVWISLPIADALATVVTVFIYLRAGRYMQGSKTA